MADGVILNSIGMSEYYAHVHSLLHDAGRRLDDFEIASSIIFSVADRHENAVEAPRPDVLFYFLYPELDSVIEKTPYREHVENIRKVNAQGSKRQYEIPKSHVEGFDGSEVYLDIPYSEVSKYKVA